MQSHQEGTIMTTTVDAPAGTLIDLIHQVDRSSHERRVKAERKLADTIRSFLSSGVR